MIARLFILNPKRIDISSGDRAVLEKVSGLLHLEACHDYRLRQAWIEAAVPERIPEAHCTGQAQRRAVQIQGASFSVVSRKNAGALPLFSGQRVIDASDGLRQVLPTSLL